ncbi:MAG TPA: hypothetical protein EYQ09_04200 [Flavobacteriales bacterium]|jgi:hypothetical protein|nr:hypothetical protein [Flavobacteriales bacterium]
MKGKVQAYSQNVGQVLSEGNVYNFHINCVQGGIKNEQEFEFELDEHGVVKVIYGNGAEKPSVQKVKKEKKKSSPHTWAKTFLTEEK